MVQGQQESKGIKLIFVGPDCAGKSTLAMDVGRRLGLEIIPNRRRMVSGSELRVEMIHDAITMVKTPGLSFIREQWPYPVDLIYCRAMKQESSALATIADSLWKTHMQAGVIVIYVTAEPGVIASRYAKRGDELWNLNQIQSVATEYERAYENGELGGRVIRVDTSTSSPEHLAEQVAWAVKIVHDLFWRGIV